MALNRGKSIRVNMDFLPRLTKKMTNKMVQYDKLLESRMKKSTQMVWTIAHQKRPMYTAAFAKRMNMKRVSNPEARVGVPVDTGALQASIIQKVSRSGKGFQGIVETKGIPYAGYIEYGTTKIRARPFMRPAVQYTKQAIKRLFGMRIDSNL